MPEHGMGGGEDPSLKLCFWSIRNKKRYRNHRSVGKANDSLTADRSVAPLTR
jgi:hypothetical protein